MPKLLTALRASLLLAALFMTPSLQSQGRGGGGGGGPTQEAQRLDHAGRGAEARVIFQRLIDSAATPAARAQAQRRMAMSYAFDGDCANTVKYEEMVIAYWKTREAAEPQNAFYQQGEMANEAARVCADFGFFDVAEKYYRMGSELGNKEPEPRTHPASLWSFRLSHALARIAARRGNDAEALQWVGEARKALDSDTAMARPQRRFFPYLEGYVALYDGDLRTAESHFVRSLAMPGNQNDPFQHLLLGMTYEKLGEHSKAITLYEQAYAKSTSHNPPAAYSRNAMRKKLGIDSR